MNKIYDKRYPVTSLLLLITTGVFLAMFLLRGFNYASTQTIYEFGAMNGRTIQYFPSQIWRLVSAIFVHIGLEHFVMNMITLYFIGRQAEDIFGSWNFLFLYLMSGILGNAFVFFFTPSAVAAGASTSLFGIFGAIITLRYAVHNPYIQQLNSTGYELGIELDTGNQSGRTFRRCSRRRSVCCYFPSPWRAKSLSSGATVIGVDCLYCFSFGNDLVSF